MFGTGAETVNKTKKKRNNVQTKKSKRVFDEHSTNVRSQLPTKYVSIAKLLFSYGGHNKKWFNAGRVMLARMVVFLRRIATFLVGIVGARIGVSYTYIRNDLGTVHLGQCVLEIWHYVLYLYSYFHRMQMSNVSLKNSYV